ncbi:hypothetical protein I9Y33_002308 [Clostridium perfringens]|nr:hypothetical protein [Clostridium perfringens]EGT0014421.1 hypothetical protein [Clostridium perfringens]
MNKLLDKYFNNLNLSIEGKEKWINDFFEENNIKNELREKLIVQEDFLKLLEKRFELDIFVPLLNENNKDTILNNSLLNQADKELQIVNAKLKKIIK